MTTYSLLSGIEDADTIYFQGPFPAEDNPSAQFWSAVHGMVEVGICIEDDHLVQVETCEGGYEWLPKCETKEHSGDCSCKFPDELDEWLPVICLHRVLKETGEGGGCVPLHVPLKDGKIAAADMRAAIAITIHPEFGGSGSLLELTKFKWQLMDGDKNLIFFDGLGDAT